MLAAVLPHFVFEDRDELAPDDLPLLLGIGDTPERFEEAPARVHHPERNVEAVLERLLDLGGLAFAQHAVVDEDALELRSDGLVQQQRDHGAVHAAGERADDALLSHPLADLLRRFLRERAHPEVEGDAALLEECLVELAATRSMRDLGMELDGVELPVWIGDGAERRARIFRDGAEALRRCGDLVAVGHPDVEVLAHRHVPERPDGLGHFDAGRAVLAVGGPIDGAAQQLGHELQAVADAEHRDAELEDPRVHHGRAGLLDARRPTGEHDALRREGADLGERHRAGVDLAVDVQLANPAGDELGVLGAEVQDEDFFCVDVRHRGGAV